MTQAYELPHFTNITSNKPVELDEMTGRNASSMFERPTNNCQKCNEVSYQNLDHNYIAAVANKRGEENDTCRALEEWRQRRI